jgi:hypothetical protein
MIKRSGFIFIVYLIGMIVLAWPARALEMDFHGDGTRVSGDENGVEMTTIPSPDEEQRDGRPETPDNPLLDRLRVDVTGSVYHHDVDGNQNRSFKVPGTHVLGDVALEGVRDLGNGHVFEIQSNLRGTDDPQVIPDQRWELRSLYGEFRREGDYRLRLGNVSASFSGYSLSSSADLGIHYERMARVDTGWAWEAYLSRPRRSTGTQYRRNNVGLRVSSENPAGILRQYGFSGVVTEDDESSSSTGSRAVDNRVISADGRMAVTPNFLVDGELAFARTDTDVTASNLETIDDWAMKLDGVYSFVDTGSFRSGRLNVYYEEVLPDFRATSGGGSPDQRRMRGQLSGIYYPIDGESGLDVDLFTERTTDNLDDQLPRETESMTHQLRAGYSPYETRDPGDGVWGTFRKNLHLASQFRFHDVETSDTFINRETWSEQYEVRSSVGNHDMAGFYESRDHDNFVSGGVDRRRREYGAEYTVRRLKGPDFGGGPIPADLRFDASRTEDWQVNGTGESDRLRLHAGTTFYVAGGYRLTADWREEDTDNSGSNNDFVRTNWDLGLLGYDLYSGRGRVDFSYRISDVDEENNSNSYREETLRADVQFEF